MNPRILSATAATALLALALAACASTAPAATRTPTSKPALPTPDATIQPVETEKPHDADAELACDTLISPGTVEAFTDAGWTFESKDFVIGEVTLPDGLYCVWGDYSVPSDHVQIFGWSEISPDTAAAAQKSLLDDGWKREDGPEGVYITENPEHAMGVDEEGYGLTYLFGDGWVKFADTKQSLILIEGGD